MKMNNELKKNNCTLNETRILLVNAECAIKIWNLGFFIIIMGGGVCFT